MVTHWPQKCGPARASSCCGPQWGGCLCVAQEGGGGENSGRDALGAQA